ncbi:putative hydroxylase [Reticulomyxa filosa]|uniref:Putative hydroxylase n=1 Tax=Reticulomyxa filosa TaxID=46433 RepID=X6NNH3_RETFI|nr:putative hydroxylase [Reticulomyxa filosa]|eukprot:ETO27264.1 putative hydroxylase [Reticulomyxa filosa]
MPKKNKKQNALSSKDLEAINAIYEKSQKLEFPATGGQHEVTFLNGDDLFEKENPELLQQMRTLIETTDKMNWNLMKEFLENKEEVNVRVIEYHHYRVGGGLLEKTHFDGGSIITAVFMLSDPSKDFEGGQLMSWEANEQFLTYSVKQGSALIFPSHKYHSVSTVTKGERNVLVIELWSGEKGTEKHRTGAFGYLIPNY